MKLTESKLSQKRKPPSFSCVPSLLKSLTINKNSLSALSQLLALKVLSKSRVLIVTSPFSAHQGGPDNEKRPKQILCFLEVVSVERQSILVRRLMPTLAVVIGSIYFPS